MTKDRLRIPADPVPHGEWNDSADQQHPQLGVIDAALAEKARRSNEAPETSAYGTICRTWQTSTHQMTEAVKAVRACEQMRSPG